MNPFTGGPDGRGWPFGRTLGISELYGLLRGVSGVEVAEDVQVVLTDRTGTPAPARSRRPCRRS